MSEAARQRPIWFSPEEISNLVNEDIVHQHAEEAAFLWILRDRVVGVPQYKPKPGQGRAGASLPYLESVKRWL